MKRGPKPKIGTSEEQQIYAMLQAGCSILDAADVLGISRNTIKNHKREDDKFCKGVNHAIASGKKRLIQKVGKSKPWQAAAWMLERKWGAEFGRKDVVKNEHAGKITVEQTDLERLSTDDLRKYREILAKASSQPSSN